MALRCFIIYLLQPLSPPTWMTWIESMLSLSSPLHPDIPAAQCRWWCCRGLITPLSAHLSTHYRILSWNDGSYLSQCCFSVRHPSYSQGENYSQMILCKTKDRVAHREKNINFLTTNRAFSILHFPLQFKKLHFSSFFTLIRHRRKNELIDRMIWPLLLQLLKRNVSVWGCWNELGHVSAK